MSSGIKKRTGNEYSDGRPGRVNYHSEDEYRTITLLVQSTAYDMQDVAHLRDSISELFDGELMLREMRIKSVEVEYESPGQRTGELQLEAPEYVNGKQIKVTMVNSPEIDDTTLVSTFTVEFETTELPYFETIYTTLELHDSGFDANAEKYGLVDNIHDEKVQYRFIQEGDCNANLIPLVQTSWEVGNWYTTNGTAGSQTGNLRTKVGQVNVTEGERYTFDDNSVFASAIDKIYILQYKNGVYLGSSYGWSSLDRGGGLSFLARGDEIRISLRPMAGNIVPLSHINHADKRIQMKLELGEEHTGYNPTSSSFTVYNAGNVTIEPESMQLKILVLRANFTESITVRNTTTSEEFIYYGNLNGQSILLDGMNVLLSSAYNRFRDTNRRFISLAPGDNSFEVSGATFDEIRFDFKYLYK